MSEQDERPADEAEAVDQRIEAEAVDQRIEAEAVDERIEAEAVDERIEAHAPRPAAPQATPVQAGEPAPAVPAVASTGDDRVDQALGRLAELDAAPVHEHASVVEAIHRSLQDTLAEDEG
jgi:hypothetical protein